MLWMLWMLWIMSFFSHSLAIRHCLSLTSTSQKATRGTAAVTGTRHRHTQVPTPIPTPTPDLDADTCTSKDSHAHASGQALEHGLASLLLHAHGMPKVTQGFPDKCKVRR
ncbi:hypothetical protein EDB80DRAFT_707646 [Ilyonectria destructans]|nr:hypothetical protein EDB80DRAFT_707646 [Ilyonectria destructans]